LFFLSEIGPVTTTGTPGTVQDRTGQTAQYSFVHYSTIRWLQCHGITSSTLSAIHSEQ